MLPITYIVDKGKGDVILQIVIAVVITFVLTVLWQRWADRRNKLPLRVCIQGLWNELNNISKSEGYDDFEDYLVKTKGKDYAKVAYLNYSNALKALE